MKIYISFFAISTVFFITFFANCVYTYTEKEFTLSLNDGKEIKVEVTRSNAAEEKDSRKNSRMAMFSPNNFENTDQNLHVLSLELLSQIYGKQRGSFDLKDVSKTNVAGLVTSCWQISDSPQKFCVLPTGVKENGIFILAFWLED